MNIVLLVFVGIVLMAIVAYFLLFPRNTFISLSRPSGGWIVFSRTGISLEAAPDHYAMNGFDHIEPYVSRLLMPTNSFEFLHIFTPDGKRGFSFSTRNGIPQASLTVELRDDAQREEVIRAFFSTLAISPSQDYLATNGGVRDSTRILAYPVSGNTAEVTKLAKSILLELCGVSPTEALHISYKDK